MKICKKCNIEKDLCQFKVHKSNRDRLTSMCRSCINEYQKARYSLTKKSKRVKKTKDEKREIRKKWRLNNRERDRARRKRYYESHKKEINLKNKQKRKERKQEYNESLKRRRISDPIYRVKQVVRSAIYKCLTNKGFIKKDKTENILGCSKEQFKIYIESKFKPWMNWSNYGSYNGEENSGWDLDHIVPISSANTEEEIIKLNHYTNFQPLCSKVNRFIKGDKINYI